MRRLAELRPIPVAVACAAWVGFVVLLPRLMLLALAVYVRLQVRLSPTRNRGAAFGGAHWTSWHAMALAAAVPPVLLLGAWGLSRLVYHGDAP